MAITIQRIQDGNKTLVESLSKVYGLNRQKIAHAARLSGIYPYVKIAHIPDRILREIEEYLGNSFTTGRALKQQRQERVKFLWKLGTYRGLRLFQGLPARGQRTHSNAQTAKKLGRLKNLYFKADQGKTPRISSHAAVFGFRKPRKKFTARVGKKKFKKRFKRRKY